MKNFEMTVYPIKTTDGIEWTVEFPDIPGCGGAGKDPHEAIEDAQRNLEVHLKYLEECEKIKVLEKVQ